jgi:hypothetical protein
MSLEPPSSSGLPGRSRPALSDLSRETTEGDLWNLDDEPADTTLSSVDFPPQPRKALDPAAKREDGGEPPVAKTRGRTPDPVRHESGEVPKLTRPAPVDEIGDLDEPEHESPSAKAASSDRQLSPLPTPPAAAAPVEARREVPAELPLPATVPDDLSPEPAPSKERSGGNPPTRPNLSRTRLNRREVIGLAAFSFALLLVAIWVVSRFFAAFEFKSGFVESPDFPVKGERVQIGGAETFWREPVRTGETRDFARREVTMIPVVEITLDPEKTSGGTLLVIYRNSEGEPVGDPIRRSFTGARFDASGQPTIAFPSTDGFVAEADFNAYRAGKGDAWMAEVFEGPSVDAPANQFKLIARIPVLPKLR